MPEGIIDSDSEIEPPLQRYRTLRRAGELKPDPAQELAAEKLQSLHHALKGYQPTGESWLTGWKDRFGLGRRTDEPPQGLYIFGPVGRGKSMIMDLFFDSAPVERKRRVHFHAFMLEVQQRLNKERKTTKRDDPLMAVAADLADETWLMCFDEFHVVNIADAMILGRLFQGMFERGVVVVATSNVAPQDLYQGGLQRDRFLPFIDLICARLDVLDIGVGVDFRLDRLKGQPVYHTPLGAAATERLDTAFEALTDAAKGEPEELTVLGRMLIAPIAARGVGRFSFDMLCREPRGAPDFLAIATHFHTIIIDDIPKLSAQEREVAKRFVVLIDSLYEHRVNLFASAEVEPAEIYPAGDTAFEFQRTVSRLMEMQAEDYIASPHLT
ncbi:MAG: cell division protein ZapE [Alphaproteobacteria bacterium]|nr:cell division protein ZapE [Alphaproteobacteria bacterium]